VGHAFNGQHQLGSCSQVCARLTALATARKALESAETSKGSQARVTKALAKLAKVEKPFQQDQPVASPAEDAAAGPNNTADEAAGTSERAAPQAGFCCAWTSHTPVPMCMYPFHCSA
jgi:hypothetical protein